MGKTTCDECLLLVAARDERALTADEQSSLEQHLDGCDTCQRVALEAADVELAFSHTLTAAPASDESEVVELPVVDPENYQWKSLLGSGGMGRVARALDRRLGREVAIKELLSDRMAARFEREARLTARLQHPAIVSVYEAGRWPSGEPFYAMSLVRGRSLAAAVADADSAAARLDLVSNVVDAVEAIAFAHSEGVVHRDLKPSNIMVGDFGRTVVVDWGLAKDLSDVGDGDAPDSPYRTSGDSFTERGVGTPQYMAPEQAEGRVPEQRVDVYALGATLYHVLAGAPPYDELGGVAEVLRAVRQRAPAPLAGRELGLPRDLCAIVDKAMARDPADRYPTARELAEDLRRFLTGQLVRATEYSAAERFGRWVARHRAVVSLAAAALVAVGVVGGVAYERVAHQRALTREQARRAEQAEQVGGRTFAAQLNGPTGAGDPASVQALNYLPLAVTGPLVAVAEPPDPRGDALIELRGHTGDVWRAHLSADEGRVVTASADGTARVWSVDSGAEIAVFEHGEAVGDARFVGDTARVVTSSGTRLEQGRVRVWEPGRDQPLAVHDGGGALAPDGRWFLSRRGPQTFALRDTASGSIAHTITAADETAFVPGGWLSVDDVQSRQVRLYRLEPFAEHARLRVPDGLDASRITLCRVHAVSAAGDRVAGNCGDDDVLVWRTDTGRIARRVARAGYESLDAAFSADGKRLAARLFRTDRWLMVLLDLDAGTELASLEGSSPPTVIYGVFADGRRILSPPAGWPVRRSDAPVLSIRRTPLPIHTLSAALPELMAHEAGPGRGL